MRRKIMKRLTLTFSTAALVLTLCACGDNAKSPAHTQTDVSLIQMEASASDAAEAVIDTGNDADENETTELMADDKETTEIAAVEETDIQSGNGKKADSDSKKDSKTDNASKKDNASGNSNSSASNSQTGSSKKDSSSGNSNSSVNSNSQTAGGNTSKPGNNASGGSQTVSGNGSSTSASGSSSSGSTPKPPATTENKPSATTESKPQTTECSHVWENIVVHHDEVSHIETDMENKLVGYHEYCRGCGMDLTLTYGGAGCGDAPAHLMAEHASYESRPVYEKVPVEYKIIDHIAYDETVGKRCTKCGYEVKY
ncbi:hypothetical protein [Eubacterium sp. MSJ-33]|uniref:hypothetical protein n=1 Tax=Eubacterium sp. MSJ-33 TaxID=2841528 RepID=UPI001C75F250|nr:hypothetical protein [Eubacterium sp. MSJ-33]QWT53038.1 hypothetical protein KP625_13450 [Eubacterium sp. MSJ-33]